MLLRLLIALIIVIAIFSGLSYLFVAPQEQQRFFLGLMKFHEFFEITLPILAFGALIKYLCS